MSNWPFLTLASLILALALPTDAKATSGDQRPAVNVTTALDYRAQIGRIRAGTLCLPNAPLHFDEIFVSKSRLSELAYLTFRDWPDDLFKRDAVKTRIEIALISVEAKLCAKAWGLFGSGARNQLSGSLSIEFQWSDGTGQRSGKESLEVVIPSDQPLPKDSIARFTVEKLIGFLAKKLA